MAVPLIPMAILGAVRLVGPKVASYLTKQGFKKASPSAAKKASNAPKMNMTQARKVVQDKNTPKRITPSNRNYQRNPDGSIKLKNGKPVLKPGVSPAPKVTPRARARAQAKKTEQTPKSQVSDVKTRTVRPARQVSGAAKEEMLKATGRRASEVGKRMSKASDKKPGRGVAVRKTTQPTAPKTPPRARARKTTQPTTTTKPQVPAKISKTSTDKGKIVGLSPKGKAVAGGLATTAAAVGLDQALKGGKSGTKSATAIPRPKKKPTPPPTTTTKKQAPPKPVDSGRKAYNKGYETMKEYFVDDMTGRKSRVKTPFGTITIDSSDKGMAFEEYESKYGGQIKGTVKRRMGGKVRGFGKAMRGY